MFSITDSAAAQIKHLVQEDSPRAKGMRISVRAGGCADFSYDYSLASEVKEGDAQHKKSGALVLIDGVSKQFLDGCTLDFVRELGASYFQINNPAATGKCGCGNSFSV